MVQPSDLTQIYPPRPARIKKVEAARNQLLSAGDPILRLELPELDTGIEAARIELDQVRLQLDRSAADQGDRSETIVLNQEFGSRNARLSGLQKISRELVIRSPIAGRLVQVESDLHEGRWVQKEMLLALVTAQEDFVARGYIQEGELHRIGASTSGKFIPEDLSIPTMAVNLKDIAVAGSSSIQILELLEVNGGLIEVNKDKNGAYTPVSPQYRVNFDLVESFNPQKQIIRGTVHLRGKGRSIAEKFWQRIARVLVKESVF